MSHCSFCNTEVVDIKIQQLELHICPKCFSTFFPCSQTMALRGCIPDRSRELWYNALLKKNVTDPVTDNACCIMHGEPLVDGKLPDYGFDGKITTCCEMFHLPPSLMLKVLKRTIDSPFQKANSSGKHHFFFIKILDSFVSKFMGEKLPEIDPLDELQYNLHLKKIFE